MKSMKTKIFAAIGALALLSICAQGSRAASSGQTATSEPADFVFTNGKVYTVDEANPWAEAVAVRGNKIVYVGDSAGAQAFVEDGTEKIDLGGKLMASSKSSLLGEVPGRIPTSSG